MSMADYAFSDHGMVLNDIEGAKALIGHGILEELAEFNTIESQFSFTGEAFPLKDDGSPRWCNGDHFNSDTVYYIRTRKSPNLFDKAYSGMNELLDELCEEYRKLRKTEPRLPKIARDEVRKRIRYILGTYYG